MIQLPCYCPVTEASPMYVRIKSRTSHACSGSVVNIQWTGSKLHTISCRNHVGITLHQCAALILQHESVQRGNSDMLEAKLLAPSLQQVVRRIVARQKALPLHLPSSMYVCIINIRSGCFSESLHSSLPQPSSSVWTREELHAGHSICCRQGA